MQSRQNRQRFIPMRMINDLLASFTEAIHALASSFKFNDKKNSQNLVLL